MTCYHGHGTDSGDHFLTLQVSLSSVTTISNKCFVSLPPRRWSCFNIVMILCPSLKVLICSLIPPEHHYFAFPQSRDCTGMMRRFRVAKIGWPEGQDVRQLLWIAPLRLASIPLTEVLLFRLTRVVNTTLSTFSQ